MSCPKCGSQQFDVYLIQNDTLGIKDKVNGCLSCGVLWTNWQQLEKELLVEKLQRVQEAVGKSESFLKKYQEGAKRVREYIRKEKATDPEEYSLYYYQGLQQALRILNRLMK